MPEPIKIYVAGPITTGDRMHNLRQAIDAAHTLAQHGFVPFVPHLADLWELVYPRSYDDWLAYDRAWLVCCQGLLRLPGESFGANREVSLALEHAIPIFRDMPTLLGHFAPQHGVPSPQTQEP